MVPISAVHDSSVVSVSGSDTTGPGSNPAENHLLPTEVGLNLLADGQVRAGGEPNRTWGGGVHLTAFLSSHSLTAFLSSYKIIARFFIV